MFDARRPLLPEILGLHGRWRRTRPALVGEDGVTGWGDFAVAMRRTANGLHALGISPGDRVGVVMSNTRATVEATFGILAAGAVAVPINLSVTDDAMRSMLSDAGVRALFVTADQAERVKRLCADIPTLLPSALFCAGAPVPDIPWSEYGGWRARQSDAEPQIGLADNGLCNIIYSSGTTGVPKGIAHTQLGRLDWAYDLALALRYHSGARTLVTLGLYSNISWVMMLCTLLAGGTLVLQPGFDAAQALSAIQTHRVTHTAMVPIQFQRLLAHPVLAQTDLSSMQAMMSCGSPLAPATKAALFRHFPCGVIELYGLTEGVITTLDPEDAKGRLESVGKPIQGTDIKLVGNDDRETALGEPGEIVGRARFVMPGYWNRPDATEAATWTDADGHRWLRTGDIGRLDEDGFLYIVDRKKDMILSGGQNVYPADIEAVLRGHEAVADCAVVGIPHHDWGETPLAVVVPHAEDGNADALKAWLNARLGKQQRVSAVVFRADLPRNPNGKVLKRELRALYSD